MWPRPILCARLVVLLLLVQHHVMASQAATMAQLKNQQHQTSKTLGQQQQQQQQQQHHVQSQLTQQHRQQHQQQAAIATHPVGTSDTNAGHNLASATQSLQAATASSLSSPSSSSSTSSSSSSSSSSASVPHLPPAQFVNDKEAAAAAAVQETVFQHFNTDDDLADTYQILSDLKRETNANNLIPSPPPPPPALPLTPGAGNNYPWNLFERSPYAPTPFNSIPVPPIAGIFPHMFRAFEGYHTPFPVTPRFVPIMSYPHPILVPYPFYMTPEMFYPGFSALSHGLNDYDDSMSRGADPARRPSPNQHSSAASYSRNSPIYYVRLPPTPYMFMPSLGLGAATPAMTGFPTMLPYQSLPSFPSFSSMFNIPMNFLANGKPASIYQMGGSPNDIQGAMQYPTSISTNFNNRLPPPPPPSPASSSTSAGEYRPSPSLGHNYFTNNNNNNNNNIPAASNNYESYPLAAAASSQSTASSLQDSKLTSLKRPIYFNGRPEDIYILPNNFNSLYSSENSYY